MNHFNYIKSDIFGERLDNNTYFKKMIFVSIECLFID